MISKMLCVIMFAIMMAATLGSPLAVQAQSEAPQLAPEIPGNETEMPPRRGFIPSRMDLRHLADYNGTAKSAVSLPARFDWRTTSKVTSVKNQGACGACYSFATVADIESKMLIDGKGTFDFSENNVKECNVQGTACNGGNYDIVANFLSRNGTVLESCDAYTASNVACNSGCTYQKTLTGWTIISADAVPSTATLQDHIYNYGPVYTALYAGDANDAAFQTAFDNYDGSTTLYYTGTWAINHAVTIVGWDDDEPHAGGAGAWICKNSWGTSWGSTCDYGAEAGYFYIAYGSASIGEYSSYMSEYMDYNATGSLLAYDDNGWTAQWGFGSTTGWGLCVFPMATDQYITHVEFWTNDITTDVDVYIYDSFDGATLDSLIVTSLDNSFAQAGYHSVALSSPPEISAGNDIVAVVKFSNTSYAFPIVADGDGANETGKTYISDNGGSGRWTDLGNTLYNDDVGIRVRTSPTLALAVGDNPTETPYRWSLSHNYPNPFNPSTTILYSLASRSHVTITIYNVLGQEVNILVDENKSAGEYTTSWDGSDFGGNGVASGIYFYRMIADDHTETAKMVLLR